MEHPAASGSSTGKRGREETQGSRPNKRRQCSARTSIRQNALDINSEAFGQLMKDYNIEFLGTLPPARWPSEHRGVLEKINGIRRVTADRYTPEHVVKALNETGQPIERDTGWLARRLVFQAKVCRDHFMSEGCWRQMTEPLVLARFSAEAACSKCRRRLWISDFPAPAPDPDAAAELQKRRENRRRCQCDPVTRPLDYSKSGLSYIIRGHVGAAVLHCPEDQKRLAAARLRQQRPDRIFGLEVTKRIGELLDKLRDLRHSPLKNHMLPYPFLVLEAKSEKSGCGFGSIERQTAFPIRSLLKMQQELCFTPGARRNFDPLVWFLANKGDEWRLYCCVIINQKFSIIDLWQGSILNEDSAIQLLLIVDYICDWARDVYRPQVIDSLEGICSRRDGGASRVPTLSPCDSNIFSLRHSSTLHDDLSFRVSSLTPRTSCAIGESHPLLQFARPVQDNYWDWTRFAAIQHASVIRYTYTHIHLTERNTLAFLDELMSLRDKRQSRQWILQALTRLLTRPDVVAPSVLAQIGSSWTGEVLDFDGSVPISQAARTHIAYRTYFGFDHWEVTRELLCITSTPMGLMSLAKRIRKRFQNDREHTLDPAIFDEQIPDLSWHRAIPPEKLQGTIDRIRDWTDKESIVAAAVGLQWCLEGHRSVSTSSSAYLPCYWNSQFEVLDTLDDGTDIDSTWALGTKRAVDMVAADCGGPDSKTIGLKVLDKAGRSFAQSSTSLRRIPLAPTGERPPFRVPKLPASVDRFGALLLRRPEPHGVLYPRTYCLVVFEEVSFDDPGIRVHLATQIRRAFRSRELYTARVANQPAKESLGKLPIAGVHNDISGAINLWINRLLGQEPHWTDWQFYDYQTRKKQIIHPVAIGSPVAGQPRETVVCG